MCVCVRCRLDVSCACVRICVCMHTMYVHVYMRMCSYVYVCLEAAVNIICVLHTIHSTYTHAHCIYHDQVLERSVSTTLYLGVSFPALPKLPSLSLVRHSLECIIVLLSNKFHEFIS